MLINRETLPRNFSWIAVLLAGTAAAIAAYGTWAFGKPRWPGGSSLPGLVLGVIAGAIMVFEVLFWPRKKVRSWRLGSARSWMRAHIWLGFLAVPLVVLHSGFSWGGQLSTLLMLLFSVVVISGIVGLVLQQYLPRMMLERVPAETIYSQIEFVAERSFWDAEDLIDAACGRPDGELASLHPRPKTVQSQPAYMTVGAVRTVGSITGKVVETAVAASSSGHPLAGHGAVVRERFQTAIGPYLLEGGRSNSPLRSPLSSPAFFRGLRDVLPAEAAGLIGALEGLCNQRRQFDLQVRLHAWLHGWLCVHVPLSLALVGLMFVHIVVALKYW